MTYVLHRWMRISGVVILLFGSCLLVVSIYGFHGIGAVGRWLALSYAGDHSHLPGEWRTHLQMYWAMWIVVASLSLIGGSLLLLKHRLGLPMFMAGLIIVLFYPLVSQLSMAPTFAFERMNGTTAVMALLLLTFAFAAHTRLRRIGYR